MIDEALPRMGRAGDGRRPSGIGLSAPLLKHLQREHEAVLAVGDFPLVAASNPTGLK